MNVLPNTHDTIVAVSSAWAPSLLGIVRLSGPEAIGTVSGLVDCPIPAERRGAQGVKLMLSDDAAVPGDLFWFRGPHSYTGQDVIELHIPGSPPLLRLVAAKLIELGARRALPGEFSARAFQSGKLNGDDVERVSGLISAENAAQARAALRGDRSGTRRRLASIRQHLLELRARIEAGIDFVDEEDVRFITRDEVLADLDRLLSELNSAGQDAPDWRADRLHLALAGLPNAGKSTLFNALIGSERAVVSPVLGTTRDVLAAEVCWNDQHLVIQDCAGLGHTPGELELAAHVAAEQAADSADLVLWLHTAGAEWSQDELAALARLDRRRLLIIASKVDREETNRSDSGVMQSCGATDFDASRGEPSEPAVDARISCQTGLGLEALRDRILAMLERHTLIQPKMVDSSIAAQIRRARELAQQSSAAGLDQAELICFELRSADDRILELGSFDRSEDILGWIFSQFCMGK
jgi:tRNA modification GTPase